MGSENWPCDATLTMCSFKTETGVLLQDSATESLLQDYQSNVFLAANVLASQESVWLPEWVQ